MNINRRPQSGKSGQIHYRTIAGHSVAFVPQETYDTIHDLLTWYDFPVRTRKEILDAGYQTLKFGAGNVAWYTDESDIPPLPEEPEQEPYDPIE